MLRTGKKVEKLENFKIYTYSDFINSLKIYYERGNKDKLKIKDDVFYYFYCKKDVKMPEYFWGKWLIVKFCYCFPAKTDNNETMEAIRGKEVDENSSLFNFFIVDEKDSEKECLNNSVLKMFRGVINDTRYHTAIPKVNEITHLENGIINHTKTFVCVQNYDEPDKWRQFEITYTVIKNNCNIKNKKMILKGHEQPER